MKKYHEAWDRDRTANLMLSIREDGWNGVSLVVFEDTLITGMHREEAVSRLNSALENFSTSPSWAVNIPAEPPTVELEEILSGKEMARFLADVEEYELSYGMAALPFSAREEYGICP